MARDPPGGPERGLLPSGDGRKLASRRDPTACPPPQKPRRPVPILVQKVSCSEEPPAAYGKSKKSQQTLHFLPLASLYVYDGHKISLLTDAIRTLAPGCLMLGSRIPNRR